MLYKHFSDFPVMITYVVSDVRNVPIEKDKTKYAKSMKKFSRDNLSFYDKSNTGRKIVVHPQILSMIPFNKGCPKLDEDNRCSIYKRKPKVCSLYPFRTDTPISFMEEGLVRERNQSLEGMGHIPCEGWAEQSEVIIKNKMPLDSSIIPLHSQRTSEGAVTRDRLRSLYLELKKTKEIEQKIEQYSELNDQSGRLIQVSYAKLLEWEVRSKKIHPYTAMNLMVNQISLINTQLHSEATDDIGKTFKNMYIQHKSEAEELVRWIKDTNANIFVDR